MYPYLEKKPQHIYTSHSKKTYDFPAHFHNYFEVAFCFSGMQNIKIGNTLYTLKKGDAAIIFPHTVHEYIKYPLPCHEDTEIVALICSTKLLAESIPDIITKYPQNPFVDAGLISEKTALAFRNITTADNNTELLGWTFIALSGLFKVLELGSAEGNIELPSKIVSYIEDNFKEDLTINHIAKVFGYHPSYVAHIFCDRLKIPFRTYLGALRSEYAASQIKTTEKSLTEIAFESGFNSLNTFCRSFKKHFSVTPSQYRSRQMR